MFGNLGAHLTALARLQNFENFYLAREERSELDISACSASPDGLDRPIVYTRSGDPSPTPPRDSSSTPTQFEGPGRDYSSIEPSSTTVGSRTTIEYGQVPEDFVPQIPDLETLITPLYITMSEKSMIGSLTGVTIRGFTFGGYGFNSNPLRFQGRARSIIQEDYAALVNEDAMILVCNYRHPDPGLSYSNAFWFGSTPSVADPDRLRDRLPEHPLLRNISGGRSQCPASRTEAESIR